MPFTGCLYYVHCFSKHDSCRVKRVMPCVQKQNCKVLCVHSMTYCTQSTQMAIKTGCFALAAMSEIHIISTNQTVL